MLIKGNLRMNVAHEFGNLDVEACTLAPVNTVQNLSISFDPEFSFKKQIDTVVKIVIFKSIIYMPLGNFRIKVSA